MKYEPVFDRFVLIGFWVQRFGSFWFIMVALFGKEFGFKIPRLYNSK